MENFLFAFVLGKYIIITLLVILVISIIIVKCKGWKEHNILWLFIMISLCTIFFKASILIFVVWLIIILFFDFED